MGKIAIFSDLHLGVHQNSDFWLDISHEWMKWFVNEIEKQNCDEIIFCGDLVHYRDEVSVKVLQHIHTIFDLLKDYKITMITGNHDCFYKETSEINTLSILKGYKNVTVYDNLTTVVKWSKTVSFCPWGTKLKDIEQSEIIFGHFELQNFKMNAFKVCESGDDATMLSTKAPLVFTGHFHLRDEKKINDTNIIYIGNPYQMDFGDAYQSKGFYILDTESNDYTFIENIFTPKHIKVYLSSLIVATLTKGGDILDIFQNALPNNLVKLVVDRNISSDHLDLLIAKMSSFKPNDLHVDYDVNYNKIKVTQDNDVDLSGVDITKAIEDFVNLLDINNKKEVVEYTISLYNRSKI
jgi:DNA repair exonuclease SbcCD nuclease subunit